MNIFITISLVAFGGMMFMVYGTLFRMRRGAHEAQFEAYGLAEAVRPALGAFRAAVRHTYHVVWDSAMFLSHRSSLYLAAKFLNLADTVKGKRKIARNRGSVALVWREVKGEMERLKSTLS